MGLIITPYIELLRLIVSIHVKFLTQCLHIINSSYIIAIIVRVNKVIVNGNMIVLLESSSSISSGKSYPVQFNDLKLSETYILECLSVSFLQISVKMKHLCKSIRVQQCRVQRSVPDKKTFKKWPCLQI